MNRLDTKQRAQIIAALIEGVGVNAISRMTGTSKVTVLKLLGDMGRAAAAYQDRTLRNLPCRRIQCDETWAFCHAKDKNLPEELKGVMQNNWGQIYFLSLCEHDEEIVL